MKPQTKLALFAGGALLAFSAFKKKLAVDGLNIFPVSDGLSARMEGATPIIRFRIAIQNPSDESAVVRSMFGYVLANGNTIGNISSFQPATILPNTTTYLFCEARLSLLGIAADVYNAIANKTGISQSIELKASMNVGGVTVPFSIPYKLAF